MSAATYDPAANYAIQLRVYKLHPETECLVTGDRKWRFDFAFPDIKLAVEIDGGTWTGGRHTRGTGYRNDCRKRNTATLLGWRVLNFTTDMVKSGEAIDTTLEALHKYSEGSADAEAGTAGDSMAQTAHHARADAR